jgi:DNA replication factor GINS
MYDELYDVWKRELENRELEKLPPDFYAGVADYVKKLKEESRMLDRRTVKANLLKKEMKNVRRIVNDVIRTRYKKLMTKAAEGEDLPLDALTIEEKRIYTGVTPFAEAYSVFGKSILSGHTPEVVVESKHKRFTLRFLKEVPTIVGADMKTYGPFKAEDIASMPVDNAKIMIKQALAEKVDTS